MVVLGGLKFSMSEVPMYITTGQVQLRLSGLGGCNHTLLSTGYRYIGNTVRKLLGHRGVASAGAARVVGTPSPVGRRKKGGRTTCLCHQIRNHVWSEACRKEGLAGCLVPHNLSGAGGVFAVADNRVSFHE